MDKKREAKYGEDTHQERKLWKKAWRKSKKVMNGHRVPHSHSSINVFDQPGPSTRSEDELWQEYRTHLFKQFPSLSSAAKAAFSTGTVIISVPAAEILDLPKPVASNVSLYRESSARSLKKSETRLRTLEEEAVSAALAAAAATAAAAAERARLAAEAALAIQAEQEMEAARAMEEEARFAKEIQEKEGKPHNHSGLGYSLLSKRRRPPKSRGQRSGFVQQQQPNQSEIFYKRDQNSPIHSRPPPPMVSPRFAARLVELISTAAPVSAPQHPLNKPTQSKRTSVIRANPKVLHQTSPPTTGSVIGSQSSSNRSQPSLTSARSHRSPVNQHSLSSSQTGQQLSSPPPATVHQNVPTSQPSLPPHPYVPPGGHQLPSRCSHPTGSSANHSATTAHGTPVGTHPPQPTTNANQAHQPSLSLQPSPLHQPLPTHQQSQAQQMAAQKPASAQKPPPAPQTQQQPTPQLQSHQTDQSTVLAPAQSPATQPPPGNSTSKTPVQPQYPPSPCKLPAQSPYFPQPPNNAVPPYQPTNQPQHSPTSNNTVPPYQSTNQPQYPPTSNNAVPSDQSSNQLQSTPLSKTPVQSEYSQSTNNAVLPYQSISQLQEPLQYSYGMTAVNNQDCLTYQQQPPINQLQPPTLSQSVQLSYNSNQSCQPPASHMYGTLPRKIQPPSNTIAQTVNSLTSEFSPQGQPSTMPHVTIAMLPNTAVNPNKWAPQQPSEQSQPSKPQNSNQRPSSATRPSVGALIRSGIRNLGRTSVSAAALERPLPIETSVAWNTAKIAAPADDTVTYSRRILPPSDLSENDSAVWNQQTSSQPTIPWSTAWQNSLVFNEAKTHLNIEQKEGVHSWQQETYNFPLDTDSTGQVSQTIYEADHSGSLGSFPQPYMPTDTTALHRAEWWQKGAAEQKPSQWAERISIPPSARPNIPQQQPPQPLSPSQRPPTTSTWLSSRSPLPAWQNQSLDEDKDRKRTDIVGGPNQTIEKINFQEPYQQAFFQAYDKGPYQQLPLQQQHYPETVVEEASSEDFQ